MDKILEIIIISQGINVIFQDVSFLMMKCTLFGAVGRRTRRRNGTWTAQQVQSQPPEQASAPGGVAKPWPAL